MLDHAHVWLILGLPAAVLLALLAGPRVWRLVLTVRAVAWMPWLSRRLAGWVRVRPYGGESFYDADGAGPAVAARRQHGLARLAGEVASMYPESAAMGTLLRDAFSDLRFTDASRVPFPFAAVMGERFNLFSAVVASEGPYLQHVDGHRTLDVSGSYGLNVAGFDQYKSWISRGWERVRDLGPVLGPVHPVVAENVALLRDISGLDEVSFHMSGTEAVMAAVRLVRFNTGRRLIVCFAGAYHGWWDGVQPGLGSERAIDDCLTLKDMDPASLAVIAARAREIAGVLVNPIQAFHPNSPPPNDAVLLTNDARQATASTRAYGEWLRQLAETCEACGVPLVLDEVYTGFRLARRGAQEYFGITADVVVYGKTVAGGLPIGVVCGRHSLMRRVDPRHPMRMAYVVGTFSAHPLVMASMREFLCWVQEPDADARYDAANGACAAWAASTNRACLDEGLPIRIVAMGTVWTMLFTQPGRYHWLLQYYLRAASLTLSWVGTGRCLCSFDFGEDDFRALQVRVITAARRMRDDGWWPTQDESPERTRLMRRRLISELLGSLVPVPEPVRSFYQAVMQRKDDDHHASHNSLGNQYLHLFSSSVFIYCYVILAIDLTQAMFLGLAALLVRQFGHAVLEPECHEEEARLLGFNTPSKTAIVGAYGAIAFGVVLQAGVASVEGVLAHADRIALHWFQWTVAVVAGRTVYLAARHGIRTGLVWFVKLVTDPFTDIAAYFPRRQQRA